MYVFCSLYNRSWSPYLFLHPPPVSLIKAMQKWFWNALQLYKLCFSLFQKIIEINAKYQEKLSSLRDRQASSREQFLLKESQDRLQKYHQAAISDHQSRPVSVDPRCYGGVAPVEVQRSYETGQYDFYRERPPSVAGERILETEGRVPFPEGRVYNNARARYY